MVTYYKPIQNKVASMEYRNFYDFEAEVRSFQNKFMEMEPHGPNKELLIVEFVHKKFIDATYQFIKGLQKNSHDQLQAINTAREELDKELLSLKDEKLKVKNDLLNKISDLDSAKNEVDVKLQCVTDNLIEMKKVKEESDAETAKQIGTERQNTRQEITELNEKVQMSETRVSNIESELVILL